MKSKNVSLAVEIYPREGTETVRIAALYSSRLYVEIYPREGTETASNPPPYPVKSVEIYPREGTET